jgi:hypothetical protein
LVHFLRIFLENPERMLEKIMRHGTTEGDFANEVWQHTRIATLRQELKQALCKHAVRNWVDGLMLDSEDVPNPGSLGEVKLVGGWYEADMIISDSDSGQGEV